MKPFFKEHPPETRIIVIDNEKSGQKTNLEKENDLVSGWIEDIDIPDEYIYFIRLRSARYTAVCVDKSKKPKNHASYQIIKIKLTSP